MKLWRNLLALSLTLVITLSLMSDVFAQGSPTLAPVLPAAAGARAIPNSYIVVLKPGANARATAQLSNVTPRFVYDAALNGFAAQLTDAQVRQLQRNPNVAYLEQDAEVRGVNTQNMDANGDPWGLDRIDQRDLPLSRTFSYVYTGVGVHAYIIDSGLNTAHVDFGGRAINVFDAFGGTGNDCHGHGTHVGGTVGGTTWGVAKQVRLYGVRVLDCNNTGSWAGVINGINFVINDVNANNRRPAVANMSLGGGFNSSVNTATANLVNAGVFVAVAAGNSNANACNFSPASTASAYTVAASDRNDNKAWFSNFGTCVDGYAPGVAIKSGWIGGSTATRTIDGTSMASPHVAGVAAQYLQLNPTASPATVTNWINSTATPNKIIGNPTGTPNRLLFSLRPDGWIKDLAADTGREPDPATAGQPMWQSPDIWVRNANDGVFAHQNPIANRTNYIYSWLRNRGTAVANGTLIFYVANASTGLSWPTQWTQVGSAAVSGLQPNQVVRVGTSWFPTQTGHFCLIVRWISASDPMSYAETTNIDYNTRQNNNIAWRNVNVINLTGRSSSLANLSAIGPEATAVASEAVVMNVRNVLNEDTVTRLLFREPEQNLNDPFLRRGDLVLDLGSELFMRWREGGALGSGIEVVGDGQIRILDPKGSWLGNIQMKAGEEFDLKLTFTSNVIVEPTPIPVTATVAPTAVTAVPVAEEKYANAVALEPVPVDPKLAESPPLPPNYLEVIQIDERRGTEIGGVAYIIEL